MQQQLLSAHPGWAWDWRAARWDMFLAAAIAYSAREGHLRVPRPQVESGFALGEKVAHMWRDHRLGKIPHHRVKALEELPGWEWPTASWQDELPLPEIDPAAS
ncbi:helicase associated domain-containing protein [Streptomyces sp. NPDC005708]|uniref:helicase associated domain-containing protein n=1 Tax=unclassified Streptomyces TaxID=2593676 RepID=UPI00340D8BD9